MKREVYEVLFKYTDFYSSKPSKLMLTRLAEKLSSTPPAQLEQALDKHSESNKYFPNFKEIIEALSETRRTQPQEKTSCKKCKGTGSVILFSKTTSLTSTFACDCPNGDAFNQRLFDRFKYKIRPLSNSGSSFIERQYFSDPRSTMDEAQLKEHQANYWKLVFEYSDENQGAQFRRSEATAKNGVDYATISSHQSSF